MLMGRSGNGLSANYISLGVVYRGLHANKNYNNSTIGEGNSFIGVKVGTGIQRLISDHLYLDINLGGAYGSRYPYQGDPFSNKRRAFIDFGFGVGYRF